MQKLNLLSYNQREEKKQIRREKGLCIVSFGEDFQELSLVFCLLIVQKLSRIILCTESMGHTVHIMGAMDPG